jgi:phage tail sheath protein FI
MPLTLKTPGVYIEEKNAFPNSIVALPTAVPAFIGYTERAELANGKSAVGKPIKINSISEYFNYYGGDIDAKFTLEETTEDDYAVKVGEKSYKLTPAEKTQGYLFNSLRLFYQNGGGSAYIISVGTYADIAENGIEPGKLADSIELLKREQEPTMLLIPDALLLELDDYYSNVCAAMLKHCGTDMRSRVALFDVYEGYKKFSPENQVIKTFRENIGNNTLDFGIAYYPWVHTTVIEATEINYLNFADLGALKTLLKEEATLSLPGEDEAVVSKRTEIEAEIDKMDAFEDDTDAARKINTAHQIIRGVSGVYKDLMKEIREQRNLLPAAPAMAGVYTMVDNSRGVWKAPANVGLNSVIAPSVSITNEEQEDLNVTLTGKSVNAIRSFVGEGVKVWGARTLDGNSQDWRYINVRRTLIFIEQSVKAAAKAYVFEPNDSNTWLLLKGMLNNFLINLWKQGALAGSSPGEAYNVQVGLGATMTPVDILDGIMRINVKVAITRPAEFIVITFQQKMQES